VEKADKPVSFTTVYLVTWISLVVVAFGLVASSRDGYGLKQSRYWRFLFEPWKVVTFLLGMMLITFAAPYSGDPTWDTADSVLTSTEVYLLAPWCIGTLYRELAKGARFAPTFAAAVLFFLPCWTYDGYILWRDGNYPATWTSNLVLSGGITLLAGLFWNLGWRASETSIFTFRWPDWPPITRSPFQKVLLFCVLLSIPVIVLVAFFVWQFVNE
jgi:hypothetical protein